MCVVYLSPSCASLSRWRCISTTSCTEGTEPPRQTPPLLMLSHRQTWLHWLSWAWTFKVQESLVRSGRRPGNVTSWLSWLMSVWKGIITQEHCWDGLRTCPCDPFQLLLVWISRDHGMGMWVGLDWLGMWPCVSSDYCGFGCWLP